MQPFDVRRGGRKCSATDEPFLPGTTFYSALIETEAGLQRKDFCETAWKSQSSGDSVEDSENTIGWWKQRVPELESGKVYWAPDEVLLAYFSSLYASNQQPEVVWVMALLLMQKRLLVRNDDHTAPNSPLMLTCKKDGQHYELEEPDIEGAQIQAIQNQLAESLFSDRPVEEI